MPKNKKFVKQVNKKGKSMGYKKKDKECDEEED